MDNYIIYTDSCSDLPADIVENLDIKVVPLSLMLNDKRYVHYLDERELTYKDFYSAVRQSSVKLLTSAVNTAEFIEAFEPELQKGTDILYLAFSSGLSNTCNAAAMAAKELAEKYPQRKIYVVDTLCASLGQGMLVYLCHQQKALGASIEKVYEYAEKTKGSICHWFTVDDLNYLRRGGRISPTMALMGTMMQIKPVLHMDKEGHLQNKAKARGRSAAINMLFEKLKQTAIHPEEQIIFISHGDCLGDAQHLATLIKENNLCKDIIIGYVGPVIGAHAGPDVLALFFIGSER